MVIFEDENCKETECLYHRGLCSCGGTLNNPCWHLKTAKDIFEGGFRSRFVLYSAYHKNLRLTATSRAMDWLEVLLRITKPENLRNYLLKIALEETRSINLLKKLNDKSLGIHELTYEFMCVLKKWHHKGLQRSLIDDWYNSYFSTIELLKAGNGPLNVNPDQLKSNPYNHYWHYKLTRADDSEFWFAVGNIANDELKEFLAVRPEGSYSRMFCSDILCGLGSLELKHSIELKKKSDVLRIPYFSDWFQDIHTRSGKKLVRENKWLIAENKHSVPNLVASGQVLGVLWRLRTVERYGDIVDVNGRVRNWKDTPLSRSEVRQAITLDGFYYPGEFGNVFSKLG